MASPRAEEYAHIARTLIDGGESYYVEFKSAWEFGPDGKKPRDIKEVARDIGAELVAFANAEGGDLLVGVEDSGRITGLPWDGDRLAYLGQAPRQQVIDGVDLGASVHELMLDGQRVLLFRVQEYPEVALTADGRCLCRQDDRSVPTRPEVIRVRRQDRLGDLSYESEPVPAATLDDLDIGCIREVLFRAARTRAGVPRLRAARIRPIGPRRDRGDDAGLAPRSPAEGRDELTHLLDRSPETLLRYWNLIEQRNGQVVLKRTALLLFAREPLRWHPNHRIRVRRVHGDEPGYGRGLRTREQEIIGPIPEALSRASKMLLRSFEREARVDDLFATGRLLPREAVEECLVNAVAHRNYAVLGQAIEILLYPDRVEVRSPGGLPAPITIDDLRAQKRVHRSRNPILMRVLRDLGWTRDQGEGMPRIFGSMRQMELHEPELAEDADTFVVRLSTRSVYDDTTQAWIASYGPHGLEPAQRRYMVELRLADGCLSVDRLARRVGESYDQTKRALSRLERSHLVWHRPRSRTYHLVEPLNVPHERALARLRAVGLLAPEPPEADGDGADTPERLGIDEPALRRIAGSDDERTALELATRWKESGILAPAGRRRWKLGPSFLEYLRRRG